MLVNRFLINLRQLNDCADCSSASLSQTRSTVIFAQPDRLGNIGEELDFVVDDEGVVSGGDRLELGSRDVEMLR